MQANDTLTTGAHDAPGLWRAEFGATVKLALPIALTQLGQDTKKTSKHNQNGHLGDNALAAAALGWRVTGVISSPLAGGDGNAEFLLAAERG